MCLIDVDDVADVDDGGGRDVRPQLTELFLLFSFLLGVVHEGQRICFDMCLTTPGSGTPLPFEPSQGPWHSLPCAFGGSLLAI